MGDLSKLEIASKPMHIGQDTAFLNHSTLFNLRFDIATDFTFAPESQKIHGVIVAVRSTVPSWLSSPCFSCFLSQRASLRRVVVVTT